MASEVRRSKRNHASSSTSDPSSTSSSLPEQPSPAKKLKTTKAKAPAAPKAKADPSPKKKKASSSSETKKPAAYLQSPFPDYERPTPEECELVTEKLASLHGLPVRPGAGVKKEPNGSVGEACGAVPSVLDALIRTILSQNTTNNNSRRAYESLLETFGPGKDSKRVVDLLEIYKAEVSVVQEAIKCGGLANVKSKVIKNVLQQVRDRNYETLISSKPSDPSPAVTASEDSKDASIKTEPKIEQSPDPELLQAGEEDLVKKEEDPSSAPVPSAKDDKSTVINKQAEPDGSSSSSHQLTDESETALLTLDYLHSYSDEDAMKALESFKGVGPKTASCVLLFCLSRDSFAVDTHVFRLSKQLGWVPGKATRETCYEHLDVRIPGPLKYPLHVLLIAHGKSCPRCAASNKTSRPTLGPCPLIGLSDKSKTAKARKTSPSAAAATAADGTSSPKEKKNKARLSGASTIVSESDGELTELDEGEGEMEGVKKEEEEEEEVQGEEGVSEEMKRLLQKDVEAAINEAHGGDVQDK